MQYFERRSSIRRIDTKWRKFGCEFFLKKRQKISITLGAYDRYLCPSNHVENAFPKLITKRFSKDKILQLFS